MSASISLDGEICVILPVDPQCWIGQSNTALCDPFTRTPGARGMGSKGKYNEDRNDTECYALHLAPYLLSFSGYAVAGL